ncbi:hypothetical protein HU147_11925 [Planomicrobium chinense]|uniref:hypothetical protein n=1 Tax=Planococcus chinensis TaxID=272917 RepID=UPI001CC35540|nr:hypothetical protein [Planococcus chinensis]MBZ5201928.1 hypothetical protein [Planococcus chinensis]
MKNYICETCGVQYESSESPPSFCMICSEERQYVNHSGQKWTTLERMVNTEPYKNFFHREEEALVSIKTQPDFAIGQSAYIVQESGFQLMWDCLTYFDANSIEAIKKMGGIDAIALSHPHYYASQVEWADALDAKIYIHEDDRQWVTRPSGRMVFWSGESLVLNEGLILHRLGGHFKGGAVLEWQNGFDRKGVLLPGDIVRVMPGRDWASFMYSYPNFIPLPPDIVERMANKLSTIKFKRVYDAFHRIIPDQADNRIQESAKRYIDALNGKLFET